MTPLSHRNPRAQRLRRLASRRAARVEEQAYVVEGPTLVLDALDAGVALESVYVEVGAVSDAVATAAEVADRAGVPVFELADGVLARLGGAVSPQGVVAVAPIVDPAVKIIDGGSGPVVVLVDLADPGNAGTLIRTAEAAGASAVVFAGESVDPYSPKTVRSSAGSLFRMPVTIDPDPVAVLDRLAAAGYRRTGTASGEGTPLHEAPLQPPIAVVLGNEAHGLPPEVAAAVDDWVHIPMAGRVESLNVAVAGALFLFEIARRRHIVCRP